MDFDNVHAQEEVGYAVCPVEKVHYDKKADVIMPNGSTEILMDNIPVFWRELVLAFADNVHSTLLVLQLRSGEVEKVIAHQTQHSFFLNDIYKLASTSRPRPSRRGYYECDSIVGVRFWDASQPAYFVNWTGYPQTESTWEPKRNLGGSMKILQEFHGKWAKISPTTYKSFCRLTGTDSSHILFMRCSEEESSSEDDDERHSPYPTPKKSSGRHTHKRRKVSPLNLEQPNQSESVAGSNCNEEPPSSSTRAEIIDLTEEETDSSSDPLIQSNLTIAEKEFPNLPPEYLYNSDSMWLRYSIVFLQKPVPSKSGKGYKILAKCTVCIRKCKISHVTRAVLFQSFNDLNDHLGSKLHKLELAKDRGQLSILSRDDGAMPLRDKRELSVD